MNQRNFFDGDDNPLKNLNIPTPLDALQRLNSQEARELQRELLDLAIQQDPQVVFKRSLDLANALRDVGTETATQLSSSGDVAVPRVLRRLCEELGATYVKLGQFIASSPTLFPPEYVQEFQTCLDATPPMPWSDALPMIEEELGRPLGQVYASVEETPLATGSIAQVHAAKLLNGTDVVIKVQRQGIQGSLRADLDLLYANARVLQLLGVVTAELNEVVGTLREAILEEIDFGLEATRTEQFAEFLSRQPELSGVVTVPKVYREASAGRVLTLERLYGVALADLESVRKYSESPELSLIIALNTWVTSVLTNEWFHADVHAGNLLVLEDGRVAFIDFGIVGQIPRKTADAMLLFVKSFPVNDMQGVAEALSGMGFTKELDAEASAAFARDLQEVFDSVMSMPPQQIQAGDIDETQLNRAVAAVGKVASNYGIRFPREFALLLKQVLYFDRYTSLLAPGLDVLNDERMAMNRPPAIAAGEDVSEVVEVEVLPPE
jgi:predicted unusual protein kinase regulating ubiquinone biosynthesis (AarF/ABC1/UbiB family)